MGRTMQRFWVVVVMVAVVAVAAVVRAHVCTGDGAERCHLQLCPCMHVGSLDQ